jgi:hypothetical protein
VSSVEAEAEVRKRRHCWGQLRVREKTRTRVRWGQGGDKDKTRDGKMCIIARTVSFLVVVVVTLS